MIPDPQETPFLTVEEAARFLGLGRSAAYDAAKRGELPFIRFGRRLLIPTAALRRLAQLDPVREAAPPALGGNDGARSIDPFPGGRRGEA